MVTWTGLTIVDPNLRAPSKPQKTQISDTDRQKEDEELQMALKMSIQESKGATPTAAKSNAPQEASAGSSSQPAQPVQSGTTAATVSRVRALFDFQPSEPGELQFKKGDIIAVLESVYKDWWKGSLRGQTGIFPLNYVEKLQDPTREELEREAQTEAEVFAQIRNVEKLLALLSTNTQAGGDGRDNEEITELYHSTLAIRPKLIELIGKYSQKKGKSWSKECLRRQTNNTQTTSRNSTKSSSRLAEITSRSSRHPCPSHRSLLMAAGPGMVHTMRHPLPTTPDTPHHHRHHSSTGTVVEHLHLTARLSTLLSARVLLSSWCLRPVSSAHSNRHHSQHLHQIHMALHRDG
jgi:hypothetical protein